MFVAFFEQQQNKSGAKYCPNSLSRPRMANYYRVPERLHEVDGKRRAQKETQVKAVRLTISLAPPPRCLLLLAPFVSVKSARGLYDAWILKSSFYYVREPSGPQPRACWVIRGSRRGDIYECGASQEGRPGGIGL